MLQAGWNIPIDVGPSATFGAKEYFQDIQLSRKARTLYSFYSSWAQYIPVRIKWVYRQWTQIHPAYCNNAVLNVGVCRANIRPKQPFVSGSTRTALRESSEKFLQLSIWMEVWNDMFHLHPRLRDVNHSHLFPMFVPEIDSLLRRRLSAKNPDVPSASIWPSANAQEGRTSHGSWSSCSLEIRRLRPCKLQARSRTPPEVYYPTWSGTLLLLWTIRESVRTYMQWSRIREVVSVVRLRRCKENGTRRYLTSSASR